MGEFSLGESFGAALPLVCVYDRERRILLFNDPCEHATRYHRAEVLGRDARDVVIPREEPEAFGEFLAYGWRTGAPSPPVGHWQTKDGGRRLIARSNRPLSGDDGAPAALVTIDVLRVGKRLAADNPSAVGRVLPTGAPAPIDDWDLQTVSRGLA